MDFGLHFDGAAQQGVVFHLIGALSEYGKLGTLCIGDSRESAEKFYRDTDAILDREARLQRTYYEQTSSPKESLTRCWAPRGRREPKPR